MPKIPPPAGPVGHQTPGAEGTSPRTPFLEPSKGKAGDDASVIFKESTEAFAKGIVAAMKPHLEKLFSNVESKSAVAGKHGAIDTIDLLWGVAGEGGSNEGFILQTIIPGPEYTLLVTCSLGKARYEERKDACVAAVDSVKLNP